MAKKFRFTACGHLGLGAYCHRCDQADTLAAKAANMENSRAKDSAKLIAEYKAEAARLRSNPQDKPNI